MPPFPPCSRGVGCDVEDFYCHGCAACFTCCSCDDGSESTAPTPASPGDREPYRDRGTRQGG